MMPQEWPIAASADEREEPARVAGRTRLRTVRADFFLEPTERLTEQERALMTAMLRCLVGDIASEIRAALPWVAWENALAGFGPAPAGNVSPDYARIFARLECHYFHHRCFLDEGQLLRDRHRIEHLPAVIVQGRFDMVCPPSSAHELADGWPLAELRMVRAGHALSEGPIAAELLAVMDGMRGSS